MKNKQGLSTIITTLILVLLVFIAVGIIWGVINNILKEKVDESESCFGNFGKLEINSEYTCYNSSEKVLYFSIERKNFELEKIIVAIYIGQESQIIELLETPSSIFGLTSYSGSSEVKVPPKNGGSTYKLNLTQLGFSREPDSIKISPIVNGNQCETLDELNEIDNCLELL